MSCEYCGSSRHKSENCHMKQWAAFLTGESEEAPEDRTLIVAEEDDLGDALEEAHALKHIKTSKSKTTVNQP